MRTKWEILQGNKEDLERQLKNLTEDLEYLERTPFVVNGTGLCSWCKKPLPTEADFAKHFLIPDERYLNLGSCPES